MEEIALATAKEAFAEIGRPIIVEDGGLFIPSLNGFPGAYSAWAMKKIGNGGVLKLVAGKDRKACFKACVAYCDENGARAFCGEAHGEIAGNERGKTGFGYDPIFIPTGEKQTFAESETIKNRVSHRFNAFTAFAKWYCKSCLKAQI